MSVATQPWLIVTLAVLAAVCASAVPVLLAQKVPDAPPEADESWRDRSPLMFRLLHGLIRRFAHDLDAKMPPARRERLQDRLNEAGLGYTITPAEFVVARWMFVILVAVVMLYLTIANRVTDPVYLVVVLGLIPFSYFYMDIWLRDEVKLRQHRIEKDFPFFLDVVVLTMKAGLAFPTALQQATTRLPNGPFRHELSRLVREIRTGVGRSAGLERLARRVRLASISNFVAVVAQAEESGGSLTNSLAEQARQRRRERFQRAEKLANQAPVKLLLPLVTMLFPATFIILGFPIYKDLQASGFFQIGGG